MTFREKLLAYSLAASAMAVTAPGLSASEIGLQYVSHPIGSEVAERYWSDMEELSVQHGLHEPEVLVADFTRPDGTVLTATVLMAMGACGLTECPVRIYSGDERVADLNACSNTDTHSVNSTGSLFLACDAIINISGN